MIASLIASRHKINFVYNSYDYCLFVIQLFSNSLVDVNDKLIKKVNKKNVRFSLNKVDAKAGIAGGSFVDKINQREDTSRE